MTCRRCTMCEDQEHHWMEDPDHADPPLYGYVCKHCDAIGQACPVCDADGEVEGDEEDEQCPQCYGEGIIWLADLSEDAREMRNLLAQWLWFATREMHPEGTIVTERWRLLMTDTASSLAALPQMETERDV